MDWKKHLRRGLIAVAALFLVILVAGYIFIHTRAFNRFMIRLATQKIAQSTGEKLDVGKVVIHWGQLKVDLYQVALLKPSMNHRPFFSCDHLAISAKILSLWQHKISLNEIVADHPVVDALLDRQGNSNFPHSSRPSSSSSSDEFFDLGIRHLQVNSGEVDYNNQRLPVSADLHDLIANIHLNTASQTYEGSLSYDRGRVAPQDVVPFEHAVSLNFAATRSVFEVHSLSFSTGKTRLAARGTVTNYEQPRIEAAYDASIFTPDVARILDVPEIPAGQAHTTGDFEYDSRSSRPLLDSIYVAGHIDTPNVGVRVLGVSTAANRIQADYVLQRGDLRVRDISGQMVGGTAAGDFTMLDLSKERRASLNASLRGASLAALTRFAPTAQTERATLTGRATAAVQAAWSAVPNSAIAHVRASIYGPLTPPAANAIPVNGSLDLQYNAGRDLLVFAPSSVRATNTEVFFDGTIGKSSSLKIQAKTDDLREIAEIVSSVEAASAASGTRGPSRTAPDANSGSSSLASLDLRGSATFTGQINGSLKSPRIQGRLNGTNVAVKDTTFPTIRADVEASPSGVSIQNASIYSQGNAQVAFSGRIGLRDWSFTSDNPISLQAKASSVPFSDLQRFTNLHYPIDGVLDANVSVRGTADNPAGEALLQISETPPPKNAVKKIVGVKRLATIQLKGDGNSVHAIARLQPAAGQIDADVTFAPKSEEYSGRVDAPSVDLSKLEIAGLEGLNLAGKAAISASGKGTLKQPQLASTLDIPQLQLGDQTISGVRAQLNLADQRANFTVASTVVGGYVEAKGTVGLRDDFPASASLDVRAFSIGPLLARYVPSVSNTVHGQAELHATLNGPLKQPALINAQVQIPTLNAGYKTIQLGLAQPMKIRFANGVMSLDRTEIKGTGTDLALQGSVAIKGGQPLNVAANGSVDLGLLQAVSPGYKSSGHIVVNIAARGGISQPAIRGEIQIADATLLSDTMPFAFESLNGKIRVNGTRLDIEQFQGTMGGGNLSASGFLEYGRQMNFNVTAQAKSVRIRYPTGIRTVMDANLNLTGAASASTLTGRVLVDRLSFTDQFDMANLIAEFGSSVPSTPPPPFEQNMKMNVAVASSQSLNAVSSKVTIGGNFNLKVNGSVADPVILGRVALTQGEIFYLGKRYELQNGTIEFANPIRTEPVLNIYAKTTVEQYNITIDFVGPLDRLRTNFTSDPPLSDADVIHLIAFGTTAEEAAASPSTPTNIAAESVLAQGVTSQVSSQLEKVTGISQITLDPLVANSTANPGSQIAIQERVSGSLLLTFSTDVTSTQADTVEVQYQPKKNLKVSLIRDYNGGYGVDFRIHKSF